jgi:hypothetical protein
MNVVRAIDHDARPQVAGSVSADAEILAMVARADADVAAGRFVTITSPADAEAVHEGTMARLRARIAAGRLGR